MSISEAFEAYRADVIVFRNQSSKTEENHIYALKSLIAFIGDDIYLDKLDFPLIRNWKISLEKRNISQATIRGYLIKLRVVLAYLYQNGIPALNPELVVLPKRDNKPIDFLSKEEVAQLIHVAGVKAPGYSRENRLRNQAIISLLYGSGIRIGEMCRLDRDAIYQRTFTAYGKGKKSRVSFIDNRTEILLKNYLSIRRDSLPALFLSTQSQKRITPGATQELLRRIGKKAGFTKSIHPHIFRHSFATNLLYNNTNPRFVQSMLGHESLETTMHYMTVVNEDLRNIYEAKHTI